MNTICFYFDKIFLQIMMFFFPQTFLYYAVEASQGDVTKIKDLSKFEVITKKDWNLAFFLACEKDYSQIVMYLIKEGIKISVINDEALHQACIDGNLQLVKFLIDSGASLKKNMSAILFSASCHERWKVVQLLGALGVDLSLYGTQSLLCAMRCSNLKMIKYFIRFGVPLRDNFMAIPCDFGHINVAMFLLDCGADINNILLCDRHRKDLEEYKNSKERKIRAVNKIINWWIPICYDMSRPCGRRMAEKNYLQYEKAY